MAPRPVIGRVAVTLAGVAIGIALGLGLAWVVWPAQTKDASPINLRSVYKDDYIRMIGAIYEMNGDLAGAKRRLSQISSTAAAQTVNEFLAREKDIVRDPEALLAVYHLAQTLYGAADIQRSAASGTPIPSPVALAAMPKQAVPVFRLVERTPLSCADEPDQARLRLLVRDAKGKELPNVAIEIKWSGGDETVYTGLKPERGVGYADYDTVPDTYTATILNASGDAATQLVIGDASPNCKSDRSAVPRGWKVVFQQE